MNYAKHVSTKSTPQSEPIPGANQILNPAGGYSFQVDDWTRLDRFLVLGSEAGSYGTSERKLTQENAACVVRCAKSNPAETVRRIVAVSDGGRAPKNDPAVFALALVASHADEAGKRLVYEALPKVCRIGTHLFQFVSACNELRGWSAGLRRAVSRWYTTKSRDQLAHQLAKYQQRDGWSHRDVLRLAHPKKVDHELQSSLRWAIAGVEGLGERAVKGTNGRADRSYSPAGNLPQILEAFEAAKKATDVRGIVQLVRDHGLTREMVPTQFLGEASVWEALLEKMPLGAMVRNLGNLTKHGVVAALSAGTRLVTESLRDKAKIKKARLHPMSILIAAKTYASGKGLKGSSTWTPVGAVLEALDDAFYLAFDAAPRTNKRWMLSLDLSGSMAQHQIANSAGVSARVGAAAMALVTAATEPQHVITGFTANGANTMTFPGKSRENLDLALSELSIGPRQRLDDVVNATNYFAANSRQSQWGTAHGHYLFGGTDCSLPMRYALERKIPVDVFAVYTDCETWAGPIHPSQALKQYRDRMGIPAKLIVVGMTGTRFTLADPNDAGMLDVVGFDTAAPAVMAGFAGYDESVGVGVGTEDETEFDL